MKFETMSVLNKPPKPPKIEGDPDEVAEALMDKLFPFIPDFRYTEIKDVIRNSSLNEKDKTIAEYLSNQIEDLLITIFRYADNSSNLNLYPQWRLNDYGRSVKAAGGHFAWLEKQRQEREAEARMNELDWKQKKWNYQKRNRPYYVSLGALLVSLGAFIISTIKYCNEKTGTDVINNNFQNKNNNIGDTLYPPKQPAGTILNQQFRKSDSGRSSR